MFRNILICSAKCGGGMFATLKYAHNLRTTPYQHSISRETGNASFEQGPRKLPYHGINSLG